MLNLHNLQSEKTNRRSNKRRGRGNASGAGNYSTRGMKGQKARSGGKGGLTIRAIKSYLLRIPKTRGFRSIHPDITTVNVGQINDNFDSGSTVNARAMIKAGIVRNIDHGVKVLAGGKIDKKLNIEANAFSASAKQQIEAAGGQAIVVSAKKEVEKEAPAKEEKEAK